MNTNQLTIEQPLSLSQEKSLVALLAVPALIVVATVTVWLQPTQAVELPSLDEQKLFELTNTERVVNHLKPLKYNAQLHQAAKQKAADMLAHDYFEHISPQGKTPWQFIDISGYNYVKAGENLAIDFESVDGPVPAWMASPGHRANILKDDYKEMAIAEATGEYQGRETTVVVQMFGSRNFSLISFIK